MRKALLLPVLLGLGLVVGVAQAGAVAAKPNFTFKMGSYSAKEGNSGVTTANVLVTRSTGTGGASVVFSTPGAGTTATPGSGCSGYPVDFVNQTGTVVAFPPKTTQEAVQVTICGDNVYEPNETVMMQLSSPSAGYSIANKNTVPLTIVNDDPQPAVTIDNTSGDEGTQLTFTLHLSGPTQSGVSVNAATADGSATTPDDYTAKSAPVTWGTNDATDKVFHVDTRDDQKYSLGESFLVNLSGATGATIGNTPATGSLNELDPKPNISANNVADWEGNTLGFTVSLDKASEVPTSFSWQTFDNNPATSGAACGGVDYIGASGGPVMIPAGSTSTGPLNVATCHESFAEANETFLFHLSSPVNGTLFSDGTGTIKNDDPAHLTLHPSLQFADEYLTADVTNTSGDPLNVSDGSPVLVRFERYTDGGFGGGFDGVDIGGPGFAGFDYTGDNKDVNGNPTIGDEGAGVATFRYTAPSSGTNDQLVACVVTTFDTTPSACGVANDDDGPGSSYDGDFDTTFGPPLNGTTDSILVGF